MGKTVATNYPKDQTLEKVIESIKKIREKQRETDRRMGFYDNRMGEIVQAMLSPDLDLEFMPFGFSFTELSPERKILDRKRRCIAEVDVLVENNDQIMVVEVKVTPTNKDVKNHIERIETIKAYYAAERGDKRKYYGAIGGAVFKKNVREFALKQGLYILVPSGKAMSIIAPEGDSKPRIW